MWYIYVIRCPTKTPHSPRSNTRNIHHKSCYFFLRIFWLMVYGGRLDTHRKNRKRKHACWGTWEIGASSCWQITTKKKHNRTCRGVARWRPSFVAKVPLWCVSPFFCAKAVDPAVKRKRDPNPIRKFVQWDGRTRLMVWLLLHTADGKKINDAELLCVEVQEPAKMHFRHFCKSKVFNWLS